MKTKLLQFSLCLSVNYFYLFSTNFMTESFITYILVWTIWILAIFSFVIGIEKMIKIILGNYILSSICLAATQSIQILVDYLYQNSNFKFMWFSYQTLWSFFTNAQMTIILILYAILLVIIFQKSKITIRLPMDEVTKKTLYIILVPLTVISVILTLQVAIMWLSVLSLAKLQNVASNLTTNIYLYKFFTLTPIWILLHWIATIVITSELKISVKTDI